jgi:hypothetical protein
LPDITFLVAAGVVVIAVALFAGLRRFKRLLIPRDWLALACLVFAIRLVWPDAAGIAGIAAGGIFFRLAFTHLVDAEVAELEAGLPPAEPRAPVLFRDDGERIVIYPSRRKLGMQAVYCIVVISAIVLALRLFALPPQVAIPLAAFAALAGVGGFFPVLIRLVWRWPALIATSDGIVDQASAYLTGFGLISWHEIDGVYARRGNLRQGRYSELVLITDDQALLARQSPFKRPFLRVISQQMIGDVHISALLLSASPTDAAARITAYVKTHAPPGYLDPEDDTETPPGDIRSDEDVENDGEVIH